MSLPLQNVYKLVRSRATGDTGTGGLFNATTPLLTGWYTRLAPAQVSLPYVVVNCIDAGNQDGLRFSLRRLRMRISIFTSGNSEASIETIRTRILGNWLTGTNRVPTYGFDRWTMTGMDNSFSASPMIFINQTELFEERVTQTILEFETYVSKQCTSP
jgi:hypothetical protein